MLSTRHASWCVPLVFTLGCSGTNVAQLSGPTAARCQTNLAVPTGTVPAEGGRFTVAVQAARECSWTAASSASWIQIAPAEGLGASELTIVAAANPQASSRSASLTVNDQRVAVNQDPMPCTFDLDRSEVIVPPVGGRATVVVRTTDDCSWSAAESDAWLRVMRQTATGPAAVDIEAEANDGGPRTAAVQIAGHTVRVSQGRPAVAPPQPPASTPPPAPPKTSPPAPPKSPPAPKPPAPAPQPPAPAPVPPANPVIPGLPNLPLPDLPLPWPPDDDDDDNDDGDNDDDDDDEDDEGKGKEGGKDKGKGGRR